MHWNKGNIQLVKGFSTMTSELTLLPEDLKHHHGSPIRKEALEVLEFWDKFILKWF